MSLATEVKKRLPKRIKGLIGPIYWNMYDRWQRSTILDKRLILDIMDYFDLNHKEAIWMLKLGCKLNAVLWHTVSPKTEEEINKYYESTPFYIFDLAYWHMRREQMLFRNEVLNIASGSVLDYGGGVGDLSLKLAEKGLDVTYGDVSGMTFEFAKWLFKKNGYNIKVIDLSKEEPPNMYDTVICIDVIEHIPHPEAVLAKIAGLLNEEGKLVITNLYGAEDFEKHPMHMKIECDTEELLNSLGLTRTDDKEWLWVKTAYVLAIAEDLVINRATQ